MFLLEGTHSVALGPSDEKVKETENREKFNSRVITHLLHILSIHSCFSKVFDHLINTSDGV